MVAELLSLRAPDVYKGKGLRLNTTIIKLKVGKQR
jgi:ribosomal protein L6P/L9E